MIQLQNYLDEKGIIVKIVINESYGGFHVSENFCKYYNIPYEDGNFDFVIPKEPITRKDKRLIRYIETYGSDAASSIFSRLVVREITNGKAYRISEYDGYEDIEYRDDIDWEIAED